MSGSGRTHSSRRDLRDEPEFARSGRSRSPACGFGWDSGVNDRKRMRAGGLTQPCRDFAAGKCRRGSHCHFLHHDNQNYEDGWESRHRQDEAPKYSAPRESGDYPLRSGRSNEACINFAKGRCRMGTSCKYEHHDNSDGFSKISVGESTREREIDRRHMENSYEWGGGHGPNHSGDTPCKFFAFGNCRNGKHCRFSHDRQVKSPNRRLREDRLRSNQGGDQAFDIPKVNDSISPNGRLRDERWGLESNMAHVDEAWDGPNKNDLVAFFDTAKLVEDNKNRIMVAPKPGFTGWPMSDGWDHSLDKNRLHGESPFSDDMKETNCWEAENAGANMRSSQSMSTDIWPGDEKMSPDWNYGVGSSRCTEEKHGQNKQQVAPGQGFNQNAQNINASHTSSFHVVGQSQVAVSIVPPRVVSVEGMQNQEISTKKEYTVEPNIMGTSLSQVGSRNPSTQNMVSKEQLDQLTSISASLVHILGSVQQLPQLHATLNSHDARNTPFLGKTEGSNKPVFTTFIKADPAVGLQKQYDPMCDSIEPKNANEMGVPSSFSPIKKIVEDALQIPSLLSNSGRQNVDDSCKTAFSEEQLVKSDHFIQLQQGENIEVNKEKDAVIAEERQSSQCANKITKENSPLENVDQNVGPDEAKKTKDVKGIRAFKYSLVEFVKELLKPTWKEGQITKEDYKSIVKKVADKVIGTVQRAHVPQTQEKIDHYLSLSKPKLSKLLQAYVQKVQKA